MTTSNSTSSLHIWLAAARPRTLPLALACIILGSLLAAAAEQFHLLITILCITTAICLQVLSNLANDYGDSVHGADHAERVGPKRAVQSGAIAAATMKRAMGLVAGLAGVSGLALIVVALGAQALVWVLVFVGLGAAAIWAAINYTAGSRPYGYAGLGDLFVLIFFGWVGTMGTYFLQTQQIQWLVMLPATSCGLLAVGVLNINNIRDIESDRQAGKFSLPVRLGGARARLYHWFLLGMAFLIAVLYVVLSYRSPWQFLFILTLPLLIRNGLAVQNTLESTRLNPLLPQLSFITLAFVLTLGLGQLVG